MARRPLIGLLLFSGVVAVAAWPVIAGQTAAGQYPLNLTVEAVATQGRTTVTSVMTIQVQALSANPDRTQVNDGLKFGGYPGALKALRAAPSVGSIQADSGKVEIRYAVEQAVAKGRRLVLVADRPLFFFAMSPDSKSRAGYELTVVDLALDDTGAGTGTMAGAARVKPSPDGGVILDDYADSLVQLTVKPSR